MTSRRSEKKASPDRLRSRDIVVGVHIIECGHGDTTLIHLPGDHWALIDCHLAETRVREHFFDLVAKHGIDRLDVVCLTHPHRDHFAGMWEVVDYFTKDGRSIGVYCDAGVDPVQVRDLLRAVSRPEKEIGEYNRLHHRLDALIREDVITYRRIDEHARPIFVREYGEGAVLIPVGPEPSLVCEMTRAAMVRGSVRGSVNDISLVLVLQVGSQDHCLRFLLAGDASLESIDRAVKTWHKTSENGGLQALKVPHHGSASSRTPVLPESGASTGTRVAAISVGTKFRALPDREVMRDYMMHGWEVVLTTKRCLKRRKHFVVEVAGRSPIEELEFSRYDVTITWSPDRGLEWGPPEARIAEGELELYETALS